MSQSTFQSNLQSLRQSGQWVLPGLLCVSGSLVAQPAIAHGVTMQYQTTSQILVQAKYESGAPLAQAQVSVYAPDSDTPTQTGQTNGQGQFAFTPDSAKAGTWQVKVRQAGHGDVINIPVGPPPPSETPEQTLATVSGNTDYTPLQKGVMAASILWGCIGTALFWMRRKA